jgi:hypothetical protein
MGKTVRSIGVTEFLNRTRMQRWPCFESTIRLREIRSTEGGDRGLGGPGRDSVIFHGLSCLPLLWDVSKLCNNFWAKRKGYGKGCGRECWGKKGTGTGSGGGEAGASSEQLSHFVEDGLHGLLIESPELDLGNRAASKVSHKLLFFFAGSKSLALWGFPNPDVCGQWAVEVGTHPRGRESESGGREALGMKKTRGAKGKTSGPQMRWLGEWPGGFSRFTLHVSTLPRFTVTSPST